MIYIYNTISFQNYKAADDILVDYLFIHHQAKINLAKFVEGGNHD